MEQKKLTLKSFKPGTVLWLKIVLILGVVIGLSYLLSKVVALFGLFYFIYLFFTGMALFAVIFEGSSLGLVISILGIIMFPLYLLIAVNYYNLHFKEKNKSKWFTVLFIISTIFFFLGTISGWLIGLSWHP
ncbi:MAG: hypothetical protein Q8R47_00735 [Nanoarchaeota archaeon]|nr:hypothetical protein [Nanoarchaeota archaeon]